MKKPLPFALLLAALPADAPQHRLPFDELLRLFQLATLDFVRWMIVNRFSNEKPEAMAARAAASPIDINQGEYRRSLARLGWPLDLAQQFLPLAESAQLGVPRA